MPIDPKKFKSMVHYICWQCRQDPSRLGAVKLNKALWASDFIAYYRFGESISGAGYVKRQHGPVPRSIKLVLRELQLEGKLEIKEVVFHKYLKYEYIPLKKADSSEFSAAELEVIDGVIHLVCNEHTAKSISEQSHDHVWKAANDGEEIPYSTVFAIPAEITEDELEWARHELEALQQA